MSSKKKWISLNFEQKLLEKQPTKNLSLIQETEAEKLQKIGTTHTFSNFDYFKAIEPKSVQDLAVHSKKIDEVETWLQLFVLNSGKSKSTAKLLITGPTGSGKALTVKLLCKKHRINFIEWINPVDVQTDNTPYTGGQANKFVDFITESNFPSLLSNSKFKKVVIVKDFPNLFLRNPLEFQSCLSEVDNCSNVALIFICSDASSKDINLENILFTDQLKTQFSIRHIIFNSCANTLLKGAIKRAKELVLKKPNLFKIPSSEVEEAIIASSMGDIRCVINLYYLAALKGSNNLPTLSKLMEAKPGSKRKRNNRSVTLKNPCKDETLGTFHALGRILNPKFDPSTGNLICNMDSLVEELCVSPYTTISLLFENYCNYFGRIEDAQNALDILSSIQCLLDKWTDRHDTLSLALRTNILGFMHFNRHGMSRWNQIKGTKKINKYVKNSLDGPEAVDCCYYNLISKTNKYSSFDV